MYDGLETRSDWVLNENTTARSRRSPADERPVRVSVARSAPRYKRPPFESDQTVFFASFERPRSTSDDLPPAFRAKRKSAYGLVRRQPSDRFPADPSRDKSLAPHKRAPTRRPIAAGAVTVGAGTRREDRVVYWPRGLTRRYVYGWTVTAATSRTNSGSRDLADRLGFRSTSTAVESSRFPIRVVMRSRRLYDGPRSALRALRRKFRYRKRYFRTSRTLLLCILTPAREVRTVVPSAGKTLLKKCIDTERLFEKRNRIKLPNGFSVRIIGDSTILFSATRPVWASFTNLVRIPLRWKSYQSKGRRVLTSNENLFGRWRGYVETNLILAVLNVYYFVFVIIQ